MCDPKEILISYSLISGGKNKRLFTTKDAIQDLMPLPKTVEIL